MVRPAQQLHEWREPAPLRPAATILLLRDAAPGIEVLMTRRSLTASFAPGAYVFPGGALDPADQSPAARAVSCSRPDQTDEIAQGFFTDLPLRIPKCELHFLDGCGDLTAITLDPTQTIVGIRTTVRTLAQIQCLAVIPHRFAR